MCVSVCVGREVGRAPGPSSRRFCRAGRCAVPHARARAIAPWPRVCTIRRRRVVLLGLWGDRRRNKDRLLPRLGAPRPSRRSSSRRSE